MTLEEDDMVQIITVDNANIAVTFKDFCKAVAKQLAKDGVIPIEGD